MLAAKAASITAEAKSFMDFDACRNAREGSLLGRNGTARGKGRSTGCHRSHAAQTTRGRNLAKDARVRPERSLSGRQSQIHVVTLCAGLRLHRSQERAGEIE